MLRNLWPHQEKALLYCSDVEHPALFLEMRLGKTRIAIHDLIRRLSPLKQTLIVGPYCTFPSWQKELRLSGVPDSEIAFLSGGSVQKCSEFKKHCAFVFLNKEGYRSIPEIASVNWGAVIADESTFLKAPPKSNHSSRFGWREGTSKFFCSNFRNVKTRFILTGTPAPESPLDLYQQLAFLNPRILGYKNYYAFRYAVFTQKGYEWVLTEKGAKFLKERLGKYCFFLKRQDVKVSEEKVYERRTYRLPIDVRKSYRKAQKEFAFEVEGRPFKETIFSIVSFQWMRYLCGGVDKDGVIHKEKLNGVQELLIGELKTSRVVIWACFTPEIAALKKVLPSSEIIDGGVPINVRMNRLRKFGEGAFQTLICQPECAKYGLDFSFSDCQIFYSTPLGLETRIQCEDRAVNLTKKEPTLIIDMVMENTIDEDLLDSLNKKETSQEMLLRMMRRVHESARV